MMVQKFLSDFLNVLVWIACLAVGGVFVGVGVRCFGGLLMASLLETKRKCGVWVVSPLLAMALVCTVVAQKDGGANTNTPPDGVSGTNAVTQVEGGTNEWTNIEGTNTVGQTNGGGTDGTGSVSGPLMLWARMGALSSGLSPQDPPPVEAFAIRPANAVENHWWRGRGAHVDGLTIPAEGWNFRTPSGFLESLLVYSYGEIQPDVETTYFPRPFPEADLSLLPEGKWGGNLSEGAESLFWHAASPSNSLILTWQNAAYNRDANCPTNLQIELFSNGTYVYRFDGRTECHSVAYPFDWDGDGLENSVDPEPQVAGPDAHGANAEWYDMVCSNVFSKIEQSNNLNNQPMLLPNGESVYFKSGINTNAYYFVDVIAERGPAPIYFNSSHPGRLGSPIVVALGGETNRVPMLIGATYSITSDVPFTVSCPTNGFAEVLGSDGTSATVKWPLEFTFTEELTGTSRSYTVGVEPYNPGGTFSWGGGQGGATLQGAPLPTGGACGCFSGNGNTVTFGCSPICTCGGNCLAVGAFNFEHALFSVTGGVCRCGFDDPLDEGFPTYGPLSEPSLTVAFSSTAVIFEESYRNSLNESETFGRSTWVRLTISAYGGASGGTLSFQSENLGKLQAVGRGAISLPSSRVLSPGEVFQSSCLYRGYEASSNESDVVVWGELVAPGSNCPVTNLASLTSVRLELSAEYEAPRNTCTNRHVYGVGERVKFDVLPRLSSITFFVEKIDTNDVTTVYDTFEHNVEMDASDVRTYTCPISASIAPKVSVNKDGVSYRPRLSLIEPQEVVTREAGFDGVCWQPGECGEAGLRTVNYIGPMHVSFRGIAVSEVPCYDPIPPTGYFTNMVNRLTHGEFEGAGLAHWIKPGNRWAADDAYSEGPEPSWWGAGTLYWKIPIGWHRKDMSRNGWQSVSGPDYEYKDNTNSRPLIVGGRNDIYLQKRTILSDGTFVNEKFGHRLTRSLECRIELDDDVVQRSHR